MKLKNVAVAVVDLAVHSVKAFLHTVCADMYIIRKFDHLPCLTFRTAAQEAEVLVSVFLVVCIIPCTSCR